jgi:hypothetical protein
MPPPTTEPHFIPSCYRSHFLYPTVKLESTKPAQEQEPAANPNPFETCEAKRKIARVVQVITHCPGQNLLPYSATTSNNPMTQSDFTQIGARILRATDRGARRTELERRRRTGELPPSWRRAEDLRDWDGMLSLRRPGGAEQGVAWVRSGALVGAAGSASSAPERFSRSEFRVSLGHSLQICLCLSFSFLFIYLFIIHHLSNLCPPDPPLYLSVNPAHRTNTRI